MKKIIILLVLIPIISLGQKEQEKPRIKVGFNFFNPIQILGNDKYYIDSNNQLFTDNNSTPEKKRNTVLGLGADIGYYLKNEDCIILNFGFGQRKTFQSIDQSTPNPYNHPNEVVKTGQIITQKQNNYNFSLFYQSKLSIKRFEIYGGVGFSYLLQGKGKEEVIQYQAENVYVNQQTDSLNYITNITYANGHSLGIGLRFGFNVSLYKNLKLGADFTNYYYYTFYAPSSTSEYKVYERRVLDDGTGTGNLTSVIKTNTTTTTKSLTDFKQFAFTNIIPSLKLSYDF